MVTGDTKVVDRGKADGIFINTAGIGIVPEGISLSSDSVVEGDKVIVSGTIGDHGLAILSMREGIDFGSDLRSDAAPLSRLTVPLLEKFAGIRAMRDATRGGLAAVLNEIAADQVEPKTPADNFDALRCHQSARLWRTGTRSNRWIEPVDRWAT